jgi:hypothetical protein
MVQEFDRRRQDRGFVVRDHRVLRRARPAVALFSLLFPFGEPLKLEDPP